MLKFINESSFRIGVPGLVYLFIFITGCSMMSSKQHKSVFRVLVFSKTGGYRHQAIEAGIEAIQKLGARNGFNVDATEDSLIFKDKNLKKYRVIVFLNNSGDVLNSEQEEAFQRYIRSGGGFVGIHGATATEFDWPWYGRLVGAFFDNHPEVQEATVRVIDKHHLSTIALPDKWVRTDEWYNFQTKLDENIHVLATVDESTYAGGTEGDFHPVIWCHNYDGGRAWVTVLGHTPDSYSDPFFLSHLLGGILYAAGTDALDLPKTLLLNPQSLRGMKARYQVGDSLAVLAVQSLVEEADEALTKGPFSVTYKSAPPPSGDKHDYISMGPYWWPNPETKNGLPYIRRDGVVNPEREQFDRTPLRTLEETVLTLALAYYYTNRPAYAARAADLVKIWFLNHDTRMNPNLKYGQFIPGMTEGRGIGIIETKTFIWIAEAMGMLGRSDVWTEKDEASLRAWFGSYLSWLLESRLGNDESGEKNNHGTWYDVQTAYLALYTGKREIASSILQSVPQKRIAIQIESDGRQPLELVRTRAFHYSHFNLEGLFSAAILGDHLGLDLWHFSTKDDRNIKKALDFLIPYAIQEKNWPYQQITPWPLCFNNFQILLRQAYHHFQDVKYEIFIKQLPREDLHSYRMELMYPKIQ